MNINIAHNKLGHVNLNLVKNTLHQADILSTGVAQQCAPCLLYKAKVKAIPKYATQATYPGERLHVDLTGPYARNKIKDQYWIKFKDQFSKMSWDVFSPTKDTIPYHLETRLLYFQKINKPIKYLRCDNAGGQGATMKEMSICYI